MKRIWLIMVALLVIFGLAAFMSYDNLDLQLWVRSLVRENTVRKAAAEEETRRERHAFDRKRLERRLTVLRGGEETLIHDRFGKTPAWAREIRAAYFARTPCSAYLRWQAGDELMDYFKKKPERQFVTAEDLKTAHPDIEKLRREAGMMAVPKLLEAIRTPRIAQRCKLDDATEISEAIIDILDKLGLTPEDFHTTSANIAALVLAAR